MAKNLRPSRNTIRNRLGLRGSKSRAARPESSVSPASGRNKAALAGAAIPVIETLEKRQMLSSVSLSGGLLTLNGDSATSNTLSVARSGNAVQVIVNDNETWYKDYFAINAIRINGGNANDRITVSDQIWRNATIYAGGGSDYVLGGNGNDTIYGGAGNDDLNGGKGNDKIYGEDGNDDLQGGPDWDLLDGGNGYDYGLRGEQNISIESSRPVTNGAGTNNSGSSSGSGGSGGSGGSSSSGGTSGRPSGGPYVSFSNGVFRVVGSPSSPNNLWLGYAGGKVYANINGATGSAPAGQVTSIEVHGGSAGDWLYTDSNFDKAVSVWGYGGNDKIYGGKGNDTLDGGDGNDTLDGRPGTDTGRNGETLISIENGGGNSTPSNPTTPTTPTTPPPSNPSPPSSPSTSGNSNSDASAVKPYARITAVTNLSINAGMSVNVNALSSDLRAGDVTTARFEWDFGDSGGRRNTLAGWTAAHLYERPGTYTVKLKVWNENRGYDEETVTVNVKPAGRQAIYVSQYGSDSNSGSSTGSAVKSLPRAVSLAKARGGNADILLQRGGTFQVDAQMSLDRGNVVVGAYGSGSKPKVYWTRGRYDNKSIFLAGYGTSDITIRDLAFDTPYGGDTNSNGIPAAVQAAGRNITVVDNDFYNVGDGVNGNAIPKGVLVMGNKVMGDKMLRRYFVWAEGSDWTILDNSAPNSTREHVVRLGNAARVNIGYNTFENKDRRSQGDSYDFDKTAVNIQKGTYAYVQHNDLRGPSTVGPLGTADGLSDKSARFRYAVFESNKITGKVTVENGAEQVVFRNNIIKTDGATGITLEGYDYQYNRSAKDITIVNNTGINNDRNGQFVALFNGASGITISNNLYTAPNLYAGNNGTVTVWIDDSSLSGVRKIDNNVWADAEYTGWAGGNMFVTTPGAGNASFKNEQEWLAYSKIDKDVFSDVNLDGSFKPVNNNAAKTAGDREKGVFVDYYDNWRSNSDTRSVGAVNA